MSRLTYLNESRETTELTQFEGDSWEELIKNADTVDQIFMHNAIDKLYEYEELEEQGLLLKLPCKIGDNVYVIEDVYGKGEFEITEYRVECMRTGDNFSMTFDALEHDECLEVTFETMDIGRTVFLSYAEAEQELKRLEAGE